MCGEVGESELKSEKIETQERKEIGDMITGNTKGIINDSLNLQENRILI